LLRDRAVRFGDQIFIGNRLAEFFRAGREGERRGVCGSKLGNATNRGTVQAM
jgi:hypothetical protein